VRHYLKRLIGSAQRGYSLLELTLTLAVLAILVMGTVPMAENSVRRQKEEKLRATLRDIRSAIDEFKRDTYGACTGAAVNSVNPIGQQGGGAGGGLADPRSRVMIDDCKIFETDNIDRYPPKLDTLVDGVRVKSRAPNIHSGSGLHEGEAQATEINEDKEIIKHYLREIPVDPMTGEKEWKLRSSYQAADSDSWDEINVFDVRSAAKGEALNGEKYSDW
jgi:general secretion pathway protein G